jgi:hypothetical protein
VSEPIREASSCDRPCRARPADRSLVAEARIARGGRDQTGPEPRLSVLGPQPKGAADNGGQERSPNVRGDRRSLTLWPAVLGWETGDGEFESPRVFLGGLRNRMLRDEPSKREAESCHRHRVAAGVGVPMGHRRQGDQTGRSQDRQGDLGGGITGGGSCWAASCSR